MFSPLNSPQAEQWLARLNVPLKRLPAQELAELHLEVRQHLDALVAAYEELGSSSEESWELALTQFGDPTRIGRKMYQEWQQGWTGFRADTAAVLFGIGLQVLRGSIAQCLFFFCSQDGRLPQSESLFLWAIGFPATVLIGFGIGRKYPHQAIKSALLWPFLWPLGLWAAAVILSSVRWMHLSTLEPFPRMLVDSLDYNVTTALLSCVAAYLASVTKRGWYKPSLADFKLTLPRKRTQTSR